MNVTLLYNSPLWISDKAIGMCWDKPTSQAKINDLCKHCEVGTLTKKEYGKTRFGFDWKENEITKEIENEKVLECNHCSKRPKIKCNVNRMDTIANKHKHGSTIEHLVYTFKITGISRAALQELARHRIASPTVKSTRYTLKEITDEESFIDPTMDIFEAVAYLKEYPEDLERALQYVVRVEDEEVMAAIVLALENLRILKTKNKSNDVAKYALVEAYQTELVFTINARSLQNLISLRTNKSALTEFREIAYAMYSALPNSHKFLFNDYVYGLKSKQDKLIEELDTILLKLKDPYIDNEYKNILTQHKEYLEKQIG